MDMLEFLYAYTFDQFSFENRYGREIYFRNAYVSVIIDGSEQQCSAPVDEDVEKSFYSGKFLFRKTLTFNWREKV